MGITSAMENFTEKVREILEDIPGQIKMTLEQFLLFEPKKNQQLNHSQHWLLTLLM